jgi:hypothetical protein
MKAVFATSFILVSLLLYGTAAGDTLSAALEPPSLHIPVELDLGGTVMGVTEVSLRIEGYGGGHRVYCQEMGGDDTVTWYPWVARVDLDGVSHGEAVLPLQLDYDETVVVHLEDGVVDWSHLVDGRVVVEVGYASSEPYLMPNCYSVGSEDITMDRLELTIFADHVVDAAPAAWSTIKAIYR